MSNNSAAKENGHMEDKISQLSDDVLLSILSSLEGKEATTTCILSKRWRYVPTYLTSLNFVASKSLVSECMREHKAAHIGKSRYVNWVNQVVSLNRAPLINDFRIYCPFPLYKNHVDLIDSWVEFALKKRVKCLELELCSLIEAQDNPYSSKYSFPCEVFKRSLDFNNSLLTSLRLSDINVSGELLELVISECQLLEHLFVRCSNDLKYLKVLNSSKRLKFLALYNCKSLKELVVDADNLQSIDLQCYYGRPNVVYVSVPSLVEAHFGGGFCDTMFPQFKQVECFRHQLSKLSFTMSKLDGDFTIPCFQAVKHLHLVLDSSEKLEGFDLHQIRCFIEACPDVEKVELNVECRCASCRRGKVSDSDSDSNSEEDVGEYALEDVKNWLEARESGSQCTLPFLREVKWLRAFTSSHTDMEFMLALSIVKNAPMLENFICNPWYSFDAIPSSLTCKMMVPIEAARERARQLAGVIPSRVELVIM